MTPATTESTLAKRLDLTGPGFRLELSFAPDHSTCLASYQPGEGPFLSEKDLSNFLTDSGLETSILEEAVEQLLVHAQENRAIEGLVLALGTPMVPGEDGRIALSTGSGRGTEESQESENVVDFHQVQEFINVETGDVVATVLPAGDGIPGMTVFGTEIPAPPGKPMVVKLGKNVAVADDGVTILATGSGRVFLQGNEISVEDVYEVRGNVDFKIGNINFNGYLEVTGDILDGFKVSASKGIKVAGNIGACSVISEGDIVFCGMNGQGSGEIRCGGNLKANFIYETKVEVKGDVLVESEIRLCGIKCLGAVRVTKRGIVGGECVALGGVDVGTLGSVTSLHTRVVVGINYRDLEEISRCFEDLKEIANRQKDLELSKNGRDECLKERAVVAGRIRDIRSRVYPEANPKINVRNVLYGGVTVSLDMLSEEFREERPGPFSMIENKVEGGPRFLGLTDLSFKACDIEATFIRQAEIDRKRVNTP
ncbi:hypothetical protein GMSM_04130 [Geomonas sp. Red276]